MFPLGDETRKPLSFPMATTAIIVLNAVVFLLELGGGDAFIARWAATPSDIAGGHGLVTLLTSMFMHASWSHIIGNMVFLWAFAPQIEDAMGRFHFTLFYLMGGIIAMLAQIGVAPASSVPGLGASGAIAAVMGAFLMTYPRDRIRTVIVLGWFVRIAFVPAILLIGLWFITQIVSLGVISEVQTGGVAYVAHLGGGVFGAATARFFIERPRRDDDLWT
jgi:membrane associated rhomboid family serine protease